MQSQVSKTIYTIGHSTRDLPEFLDLLKLHGIRALADVRRFPGSRRFPHFGQDALSRSLAGHGIAYRWFEMLGGRRSVKGLSPQNSGWQVKAFHAYADYMQTDAFKTTLAELEQLAAERPTAYMCAEALWTRCHRRLISDALLVRGWRVLHVTSRLEPKAHELTAFAKEKNGDLSYPALKAQPSLFD
jgi:uncharacterized protein (DUF488 family)